MTQNREGKLYVFEGPDGVGKTTLALEFAKKLGYESDEMGNVMYYAFPGKVPGTVGAHIYDFHHNWRKYDVHEVNPDTLQFLHIVAHVDAIRHVLLPLLREGMTVVLDRWWLSTLVYGLYDKLDIMFLVEIIKLEKLMWEEYTTPDAVFLIDREEPIDREVDGDEWQSLRSVYADVFKNSSLYCAYSDVSHVISNEQTIDDALQNIIDIIR